MSLNQPKTESPGLGAQDQKEKQEPQPAPPLPNTTKAPLIKPQDPRAVHVPESYFVYLLPGHTLAQHSAAIGRDIQPHIQSVLDFIHKDRTVYIGKAIDEELLDLIRMDKGVEKVREECYGGWT